MFVTVLLKNEANEADAGRNVNDNEEENGDRK
jgi:hypothetical protein